MEYTWGTRASCKRPVYAQVNQDGGHVTAITIQLYWLPRAVRSTVQQLAFDFSEPGSPCLTSFLVSHKLKLSWVRGTKSGGWTGNGKKASEATVCYDDWETETASSLIPKLRSVRTSLHIMHEQRSQCWGQGSRLDGYLIAINNRSRSYSYNGVATFLYIEKNAICVRQFTSTESHGNAQWLSRTTLDSALKTHNYCIHLKKRWDDHIWQWYMLLLPLTFNS